VTIGRVASLAGLGFAIAAGARGAPSSAMSVPRFSLPQSGLEIASPIRFERFFDVVGRRSAIFGRENAAFEAWAYPLKLVDEFGLSFRLRGYPLEIEGREIATTITVRPEATIVTHSHSAFTVREILFAPVDEPGVVVLLDVDSVLPLTIRGRFRPRLRLMWPAGLMTPNLEWSADEQAYYLTEESRRFVGTVGVPGRRDLSVMPYQEEPRDVPIEFELEAPPDLTRTRYLPIVMAGSVKGRDEARATRERLLGSAAELYSRNVAHYRRLLEDTARVKTPDPRIDASFAWAKVGIDKGLATNPALGTGLLAGFRTSGDSERPGFGWFFGRDALWTTLAIDAYGDFSAARVALEFLERVQRADGKVPHEISQSAPYLPWFEEYPYPWNSADATPLYVIAHADLYRASGDRAFLDASWDSIVRAFRFTLATDTDGNGLVENTRFGHGWVEGGDLYPAHEEIYQQGVWIQACRDLAELAEARGDRALAAQARGAAERTRAAFEATYWVESGSFYAFATQQPRAEPLLAEPGPQRERRQARLDALRGSGLVDEDTVLPAVPLWWGLLDDARAQSQIDRLGAGALATDWGTRLLSSRSALYDPLSYHHGSVWPLFTGWASVAAYRYGRPHVGYQALLANVLLRSESALGYVTELLSGDFRAAFGRSSHHQVWSEAMVVTPLLRGLLGIAASDAGRALRFAPSLPAGWERVSVRNLAVGGSRYDLALSREPGRDRLALARSSPGEANPLRLLLAPAYPLDARIRAARVDGRAVRFEVVRAGDVQRAELTVDAVGARCEVVIDYEPGTDVYVAVERGAPGSRSEGLRVLRSRAEPSALRLVLEGLGGRSYAVAVRSPRVVSATAGVEATRVRDGDFALEVSFEGPGDEYVRREVVLPLR
jgi:glycogen debranching enzyme